MPLGRRELTFSSNADASKSLLRAVAQDLGGDATTVLSGRTSTEAALDEAELETRVNLLRKALS